MWFWTHNVESIVKVGNFRLFIYLRWVNNISIYKLLAEQSGAKTGTKWKKNVLKWDHETTHERHESMSDVRAYKKTRHKNLYLENHLICWTVWASIFFSVRFLSSSYSHPRGTEDIILFFVHSIIYVENIRRFILSAFFLLSYPCAYVEVTFVASNHHFRKMHDLTVVIFFK